MRRVSAGGCGNRNLAKAVGFRRSSRSEFRDFPDRFLIRCTGATDTAEDFHARPITVAGEIQEEVVREGEVRPLGRFLYLCPATQWSTAPNPRVAHALEDSQRLRPDL
ncbi:protein of unknown function [Methylocaldum szegediense]|uniref:Uncharacterized protein n=1 Tax=Methylocaldum szegediense TaxID=73780 RepID=A0ABM9HZL8_9GAMM|nr:protein of unknown function [Methylocaldum szegediense]